MQYPLSSFFLRLCVARRSKAAHISRSSPHQVLGNSHEKRLDVDEVLYQHYVKKLLVGYLYGGGPTRLGLHRTPVHPGARCKGQVLWRHHPTASGRACPRVADWGVADGAGDGHYRARAATLPAGNGLTALFFSFLPSCQGAKTPLRHPWAFCAYATVVKATSVSNFRQCPVPWQTG